MEKCTACNGAIGDQEMPRLWQGTDVVCPGCWDRLSAIAKPAPSAAGPEPRMDVEELVCSGILFVSGFCSMVYGIGTSSGIAGVIAMLMFILAALICINSKLRIIAKKPGK